MGAHAWLRTPCAVSAASTSDWRKYGWTSIWLTAGTTSVSANSWSRCDGMKLETPIVRTLPSALSFSSARYAPMVSSNSPGSA
jgi:hypothetical protein